jgi:type II secretory pathway pseudopilin PulG
LYNIEYRASISIGEETAIGDDRFANRPHCNRHMPLGESMVGESCSCDSRFRNKDRVMVAKRRHSALTLIELLVVLAVLIVLAGLIVPMFSSAKDDVASKATIATLSRLREVILDTYRRDMSGLFPRPGADGITAGRQDNPQLRYLFLNPGKTSIPTVVNPSGITDSTTQSYDPFAQLGWRGPYLQSTSQVYPTPTTDAASQLTTFSNLFGNAGDPTIWDGWNNPIIVRLTSTDAAGSHYELRSAGPDGKISAVGVVDPTLTDDIFVQLN